MVVPEKWDGKDRGAPWEVMLCEDEGRGRGKGCSAADERMMCVSLGVLPEGVCEIHAPG